MRGFKKYLLQTDEKPMDFANRGRGGHRCQNLRMLQWLVHKIVYNYVLYKEAIM